MIFLGLFIGDLDPELVFECHHQLDGVERVGAEVGDEGLVVHDIGFRNAKLFGNDFFDACFDIAHDSTPPGVCLRKQPAILRPAE